MTSTAKQQLVSPLPPRRGVGASRVWLPKGSWQTIGEFLLARFPHLPPAMLAQRVGKGDVVDSQGLAQAMLTPYQADQWLWYYREVEDETPVPFEMPVLFADDRLIAVDKPHFLASIPSGRYLHETALSRVRAHFNNVEITPLHRLDRDTAGVLLFCVQPKYRGAYQQLFQSRDVYKIYEAVAPLWDVTGLALQHASCIETIQGEFFVREVEKTPNSKTDITLLSQWPDPKGKGWLAHYQLHPETGKKHQLRVHLSGLGVPIVNDAYYPQWDRSRADDDFSRPLQLLARKIAFTDPVDGQPRSFSSPRRLTAVP